MHRSIQIIVSLLVVAFLLSASLQATTIRVPANQPTIQAGIDAAIPGDTVLVADGTYTGDGNRDIDFGGNGVVLKSENGADVTIIDCELSGRGFNFHSGEDSSTVVHGFTIKNGVQANGSGAFCINSSPAFIETIFANNTAGLVTPDWGRGGAVFAINCSPTFIRCTFVGNSAAGAINCDLYGCSEHLGLGNAIYCQNSNLRMSQCIVAFNGGGFIFLSGREAIYCVGGSPIFECNDFYGNFGSNWGGLGEDPTESNSNFSANPLFCDKLINDYSLNKLSPCAATNNSCNVLIGALDIGCDTEFVCADANGDGEVTQDDLDFLIAFYFSTGPAPISFTLVDLNLNGMFDLGDIVYLAQYLAGIGPAPTCEDGNGGKKDLEGRRTALE